MNATAVTEQAEPTTLQVDAVEVARGLLARHDHFRARAHTFEIVELDGVITVSGQVPTFYLKQLLQQTFANVAGTWRVVNRVDVVSPDGLSSQPRR